MVALSIYVVVPKFDELFAFFGPNIPASSRILIASYPFAFLLPVFAAGLALVPGESSRWSRLVVPLVYASSFAIVVFVAVALYAPVYKLANETEGQHAP